jgi:hypothetical protein
MKMRLLLTWATLFTLTLSPAALAERADTPMWRLAESPFQLEVTVLSLEEKRQTDHITNVWHRVRIERVVAGSDLKVGDETAVVSQRLETHGVPGSSGDRGPFKGPSGLPAKCDRARLFAEGSAKLLKTVSPNGWQLPDRGIAFVAADDANRSDVTMPFIAKLVQDAKIGRAIVFSPSGDDVQDPPGATSRLVTRASLSDSWRMTSADASILSMRRFKLGHQEFSFASATKHGLPIVGFRDSIDAFCIPGESRQATWWNDRFPIEIWGARWKGHFSQKSKTRILPPDAEAATHPVLAGVSIPTGGIVAPSWLYEVDPLPSDCLVLLWGEAIDGERPDSPNRQPILWVREKPRKQGLPPQRIAFTTLGHPSDFVQPEVRLLAVQMIAWAVGEEARMDDAARRKIRDAEYLPPEVHLAAPGEP